MNKDNALIIITCDKKTEYIGSISAFDPALLPPSKTEHYEALVLYAQPRCPEPTHLVLAAYHSASAADLNYIDIGQGFGIQPSTATHLTLDDAVITALKKFVDTLLPTSSKPT